MKCVFFTYISGFSPEDMNTVRALLVSICVLVLFAVPPISAQDSFSTSFESNPLFEGWFPTAGFQGNETNTWTPPGENSDGYITINNGRWHAPTLQVEPFHYYRLTFTSRTVKDAFWAVFYYDNRARAYTADQYSEVYRRFKTIEREGKEKPEKKPLWRSHEFVFMAEHNSVGATLYFQTKSDKPLDLNSVSVEPISDQQVLEWADALYSRLPELKYEPPSERHDHLQETIEKLENGEEVTIVMLGDSVANDLSNGTPNILLQRAYPDADVRWITSVVGGKGPWYYRRSKKRIQKKVIQHDPDLLILGGVSHFAHVPSFRDVIEQVRSEIDPDIMVTPGVITPIEGLADGLKRDPVLTKEQAMKRMKTFPDRLRKLAEDLNVEYANLRTAWEQYVKNNGKKRSFFMRDGVHGNTRGKQIAARILIRYLSPVNGN